MSNRVKADAKDMKRRKSGVHLQHSSDTEVKSNQGQKKKGLLSTADEDKCLGEGIKLHGFGQWSNYEGSQIQVPKGQDCKLSIVLCIVTVQLQAGLPYK